MHMYCPFISPVTAPSVSYCGQRSGWMVFQDWTGIDVQSLNGKGWWVLWLSLTHFTTSQKHCCPGINGLKRMRTVVEEASISYKGTEEPLKFLLIHSCTSCRERCQNFWWSCSWMAAINVSQQPLDVRFYLKHHTELSVQVFVIRVAWNPWDCQSCNDTSLNVLGVLLAVISCVKGNYTDIWLNYKLPGETRLYLLWQHKVRITLTATALCREKSFGINHQILGFTPCALC